MIGSDNEMTITSQEWISLQEASSMIGTSPSTIRRWADNGKIPTRRTMGGYRRFSRSALLAISRKEYEAHQEIPTQNQAPPRSSDLSHQIIHQEWHMRMVSHAAEEKMRSLGNQLLGLMILHINSHDVNSRFLSDARAVGASYGAEAHDASISMHDMVEAFLFFRSAVSQFAVTFGNVTQPKDLAESEDLRKRLDRFMDEVLLGAIESYENALAIGSHNDAHSGK